MSIKITTAADPALILATVEAAQLDDSVSQSMDSDVSAAAAASPGTPVLLNLSAVTYMPSTAIGALMTLWKKLRNAEHRLIIVGMAAPVRHTLALCRLDKFFEFCDTEPEARSRLTPNPDPLA